MHHNSSFRIARAFEQFLPMKDVSLFEGWAAVFNAPVQSSAYLQGLLGLSADFERFYFELELSKASDRAKALYHRAAKKLEPYATLVNFPNHHAGHIKSQSDSIDVMFLAADVTGGLSSGEVNPVTLSAIIDQLTGLLTDLDHLEVDERLKRFLKFQVGNMLQAVSTFDAIGIEGLSRIYGATASEISRAFGMAEAHTPEARGWLTKARGTLKLIGEGVVWLGAVTGGANLAIENGTHLLEHAGIVAEAPPANPN